MNKLISNMVYLVSILIIMLGLYNMTIGIFNMKSYYADAIYGTKRIIDYSNIYLMDIVVGIFIIGYGIVSLILFKYIRTYENIYTQLLFIYPVIFILILILDVHQYVIDIMLEHRKDREILILYNLLYLSSESRKYLYGY